MVKDVGFTLLNALTFVFGAASKAIFGTEMSAARVGLFKEQNAAAKDAYETISQEFCDEAGISKKEHEDLEVLDDPTLGDIESVVDDYYDESGQTYGDDDGPVYD